MLHKLMLKMQWDISKWDFTPLEKQILEAVMRVKQMCVLR